MGLGKHIGIEPSRDYFLDIARGYVSNHTYVKKFGLAENIDTADGYVDIWDGCNVAAASKTYTFSTAADIDSLSSSDNGDTQDVTVVGLDTNWDEVTQTITLTGQTRAALTTSLIRVYRMYNAGTTDFAGNVFCFKNVALTDGVPNTAANIRAIVQGANNQTLMAIYTIPAGYTGYLVRGWANQAINKTAANTIKFMAREFGGVFRVQRTQGLNSVGSSLVETDEKLPFVIPEKTDLKVMANTTANDMALGAGFDIVLEKN